MNFYAVIIGTEILNGRRDDKHFNFLREELLKRGFELKGSFIIKDDPIFMENIYNLIKQDKNSVMFSFGGIGATPDDYTREVSAKVFTNGKMEENKEALAKIIDRFKDEAYPNRVKMANLPVGAKLLENIVTNVPGYYLEDRFFFVPGFPSMAWHMVKEALDKYYKKNNKEKYRLTLSANCSENNLIQVMQQIDPNVELSSLPIINENGVKDIISISGYDKNLVEKEFKKFIDFLEKEKITYILKDSEK